MIGVFHYLIPDKFCKFHKTELMRHNKKFIYIILLMKYILFEFISQLNLFAQVSN